MIGKTVMHLRRQRPTIGTGASLSARMLPTVAFTGTCPACRGPADYVAQDNRAEPILSIRCVRCG